MNLELKLMLSVTHRLPKIKGSGWFANKLKTIYNRKARSNESLFFHGIKMMDLEPNECVDGGVLFYPQLYDWKELVFIKKNLKKGGKFIDAGANIGWYSLHASNIVGSKGRVMAIEMDDYNAKKLNNNIQLNRMDNIDLVHVGLSDCSEEIRIRVNKTGNRGGNSLVGGDERDGVKVPCLPLLSILISYAWKNIDGMKIDIEGMEYRVLSSFYEQAPRELYPKFVIVEINNEYDEFSSLKLHDLFFSYGYKLAHNYGLNSVYIL